MKIAVTICTRRRPTQLDAALRALSAVKIPKGSEVFAIVIENDDTENVRELVERWSRNIAVHYFLESEQGISAARNRALDAALQLGADWVATCDDDGEMERDCLVNYILTTQKFPSSRLFVGRTRYIYPESMPLWYPRIDGRPIETGKRPNIISTANSFFHRDIIARDCLNLRFDLGFGLSGGEDLEFFFRARKLAGPIIWVEEAVVFEKLIESRANIGFYLRRQVRNGQNVARVLRKNRHPGVAFLSIVHTVYRYLVRGLALVLVGGVQLLVNETAGLTRVFAGFAHFSSATGMVSSYFRPSIQWYKKTDGH